MYFRRFAGHSINASLISLARIGTWHKMTGTSNFPDRNQVVASVALLTLHSSSFIQFILLATLFRSFYRFAPRLATTGCVGAFLLLTGLLGTSLLCSIQARAQPVFQADGMASTISLPPGIRNAAWVRELYSRNKGELVWLKPGTQELRTVLRVQWQRLAFLGLDTALYERDSRLRQLGEPETWQEDSAGTKAADMRITDAALTFLSQLYQGKAMDRWISYDEISAKCAAADRALLLDGLLRIRTGEDLAAFVQELQPVGEPYQSLCTALVRMQELDSSLRVRQLQSSLNYFRWIHHFHLPEFVVVNIGSAEVSYYRQDSVKLLMKAVVGKPETKTPRFAAYVNQVVLYPYWNVPRSIAVGELLPRFRKSPGQMKLMSIDALDARGRVVDPSSIPWRTLSSTHFPYRFRERTGCFNPLGVVKFNITDPYSVYLHDTNFKGAFLAQSRYYSHGCIRVEDPVALAHALLKQPLDTAFLLACHKDQEPIPLDLPRPVPVFSVYMTAILQPDGSVRYFRDLYHLLDK